MDLALGRRMLLSVGLVLLFSCMSLFGLVQLGLYSAAAAGRASIVGHGSAAQGGTAAAHVRTHATARRAAVPSLSLDWPNANPKKPGPDTLNHTFRDLSPRGNCNSAPRRGVPHFYPVIQPTLFIIGWQHSGAQSLGLWMSMHPSLSYGSHLMKNFYCIPTVDLYIGADAYLREFRVPCTVQRTFDVTPYAYQMANESSAHCHFSGVHGLRSFQASIPAESQFIVLLRDPVDRLNSYFFSGGERKTPCLDQMLEADGEPCYADLLEIWLNVFPREKFLFLESEELYSRPQEALDKVFRFAGVEPRRYNSTELAYRTKHRDNPAARPAPSPEARRAYHKAGGRPECRQRLERLTGLNLSWPGEADDAGEQALAGREVGRPQVHKSKCRKILPPTAYILGFEHGGTTKLSEMMNAHPQISYGFRKEHYFWCGKTRSREDYFNEFHVPLQTKVAFDGCPVYYQIPHGDPCRLKGQFGLRVFKKALGTTNYKFIMLFRNPFDWMHSMLYTKTDDLPLRHGKWNACHADYIERWLDVFPRDRFLFLRSEDLYELAQPTFDNVTDFLEVERFTFPPKVANADVNAHKHKDVAVDARREFLQKPEVAQCQSRLENLTGLRFNWTP